MALKLKGLLSDCELLLTPLTSDQEGHLRGGFGSISVAAANNGSNRACSNASACKKVVIPIVPMKRVPTEHAQTMVFA